MELGVFIALTDGPKDKTTLAKELACTFEAARNFLDALVTLGILDPEQKVYCNTPATDASLDRRKPAYADRLPEIQTPGG
jgi:hypothetical protein